MNADFGVLCASDCRILLLALSFVFSSVAGASLPQARYSLDRTTGAISGFSSADGRKITSGIETVYRFMSRPKDVTARERDDRVVSRVQQDGVVTLLCRNPELPDVLIGKCYRTVNGGLRRTLSFSYDGNTNAFILPFTECRFPSAFLTNAWHLGAGYIGPYKPFPHVERPRQVNEFRQSSKGMVIVNPGGAGSFSHYRVKINDTVVLPWWHSTIGHYREYDDRLWYLPDGYRMGLGTLDLKRGETISVTDTFNAFDGDAFTFFDKVFAGDDEVMAEIRAIPEPPAWIADIFACVTTSPDCLRYMLEMTDDGIVMTGVDTPYGDWCDYRPEDGFTSFCGGHITGKELYDWLRSYTSVSERVRTSLYHIVISASETAPIVREHPEWFRMRDRNGGKDSLFPGLATNWQTMFNNADCRSWIADMLMGFASYTDASVIYLDEAQMTNTIDWDRERLTRDDHTVLFWRDIAARAAKKNLVLFFNGSGLPYAGINYMESPHELAPKRWRDWVGVAWGIGMMNRFRPSNRTIPLYWSQGLDYVNRILALGWVPRGWPRNPVMPALRAAYQSGALVPIAARYTPDWKVDSVTPIESHAMTRTDCPDKLLSFINRAHSTNDVSVTVDLGSLGFAPDERINVWRLGLRDVGHSCSPFTLADRELKENWRKFSWNDGGTMTRPVLVHSGSPTGELGVVFHGLKTDEMGQILVTSGPMGFYAVENKPLDYFYTHHRKGSIKGRNVSLKAPSDILLADADCGFGDVTANGRPAKVRPVDVGGRLCALVSLPAGEWTLDWERTKRPSADMSASPVVVNNGNGNLEIAGGGLFAIERDGVTVHTGTSPVILPVHRANGTYRIRRAGCEAYAEITLGGGRPSNVNGWRPSFLPGQKKVEKVSVRHGDVTVSECGRWIDRYEITSGLQTNLPPAVAEADPNRLTLESGTTRREGYNVHHKAWAGMELNGVKTVKMRFDHTFAEPVSIFKGHVHKNADKPESNFTGLVLDFRVSGKYTKRVSLSAGLYNIKYSMPDPPWGAKVRPGSVLSLGDFISLPSGKEFALDIAALAPKGWDGTVYLSLGTARIMSGRRIKVTLLGFNESVKGGFVVPESAKSAGVRKTPPPAMSRPLRKAPASLVKLDAGEWSGWKALEPFQLNGTAPDGVLQAKTRAWIAHDYEYVYLGVEAKETRAPLMDYSTVIKNERIEFMMVRPDGSLYQAFADATGHKALYVNGKPVSDAGIITRGEIIPGECYRVFFALPVNELKFDMQRTPVKVKGDVCRVRMDPGRENSAWAPLPGAFKDVSRYGTFVFDFNW